MSGKLTDEVRSQITESIFAGRKIEAIKQYRAAIGLGLKEAKDFIEALTEELHQECPEKFTVKPGTGCGAAAMFIFMLCSLSIYTLANLHKLL